nr:MAG TPA: hypothetical protein [Caudoviricetes sp.]
METKFLNTFQKSAFSANGGNKSGNRKNRFCFRQKVRTQAV